MKFNHISTLSMQYITDECGFTALQQNTRDYSPLSHLTESSHWLTYSSPFSCCVGSLPGDQALKLIKLVWNAQIWGLKKDLIPFILSSWCFFLFFIYLFFVKQTSSRFQLPHPGRWHPLAWNSNLDFSPKPRPQLPSVFGHQHTVSLPLKPNENRCSLSKIYFPNVKTESWTIYTVTAYLETKLKPLLRKDHIKGVFSEMMNKIENSLIHQEKEN